MMSDSSSSSSSSSSSGDSDDDTPLISRIQTQMKANVAKVKPVKRRQIADSSDDEDEDEFVDDDAALDMVDVDEDASLSDDEPIRVKRTAKRKASDAGEATRKKRKQVDADSRVYCVDDYEVREVTSALVCNNGAGKWWNLAPLPLGQKWNTLTHNGVLFPDEYKPHNVPLLYDNKIVELTPEQEEVATFYAQMIETDYVQNNKFNDNFFKDWKSFLGKVRLTCLMYIFVSHE